MEWNFKHGKKIDKKNDDILEKLVHINRITKVVKGGEDLAFCTRCCRKSSRKDRYCTCESKTGS